MAIKFEKFESPGKGNGLRATSLLSPGDQLYSAVPYSYAIGHSSMGSVCEFCLYRHDNLLRCSRCKYAKYCDTCCQAEAWPDHKRECKCLADPQSRPDIASVRLVGKIIFKMLRKSPCPSEELYSLSEHQSNYEKLSRPLTGALGQFEKLARLYLQKEIPDPSCLPAGFNIQKFFATLLCNSFTISNNELQKVALGLYPSMSLLNHSCEPNCTIVFEGTLLLLRAVREIQAGEELTIRYIDTMMPTAERQTSLQGKYCFQCDCRWCRTKDLDEQMLAGDQRASDDTKQLMTTVSDLQSEHSLEEILRLCKAQLDKNVGLLPDTNIYQLAILDHTTDACMGLSRWDEALSFGSRTLESYRLYNPGFVPIRALQMLKVGKLLYQTGWLHEAMVTFNEALAVMMVTHGTDHDHTRGLMKILHC